MVNNNINNINQQHIAPKTTHWALKGFVKDNIDNRMTIKNNVNNENQQGKQKLIVPIERYTLYIIIFNY